MAPASQSSSVTVWSLVVRARAALHEQEVAEAAVPADDDVVIVSLDTDGPQGTAGEASSASLILFLLF